MSSLIDAANARRWDGVSEGHYEVWYLTFDHAASDTSYWIRYTLEAPQAGHEEPYAGVWFARFDARRPERNFGIHRRFPIAAMQAASEPFFVSIAANRLTSMSARGDLAGNGHAATWDLQWPAAAEVHRQLPDVMYRRGGLGETTLCSPNVLVPLRGTLTVDGVTLTFEGEPAGQTHLWGRKHAFAWAWGRCTFRDRPDAVLEALTVRLRRRGVTLPPVTIAAVRLGDELIAMNQFRHTAMNRGSWETGRYTLRATNATARIHADFTCRPADMIVAPYVDPDGEASYCANTEVGTCRLSVYRRRGLRWHEETPLVGRAHFEIGGRVRDTAVANDHVLVG